ncbi:MAG TPA: Ig-like domain-containing protein [Longimicrobium sp.]|nr:Ig-like domain-containing protein [Longimicrobium sp.]
MPYAIRPALAGLLLFSALAACTGDDPVAPATEAPAPVDLAQLDCRVTLASGAMTCSSASSLGGSSGLIVGGQGTYVFLEASNHAYQAVDQVYSIDVTVQNLIPQALGTTDGVSAHAEGVRVFFIEDPVATDGSGLPVASLAGASAIFSSGAPQQYYEYPQMLATNQTSEPVTWDFSVPAGVASIGFKVYVAAQVPFPNGWIDLTPPADTVVAGGTQALTATVRNVVGVAVGGQTVSWQSSAPEIGTVDGAGLVTGVAPGGVTITATSGLRSGTASLAVCPDLAVGGVYTASMPAAASLCLAGGAEANAEYTYMPVNLSQVSSLSLSLVGSGIVPVTGPPSPSLAPRGPLLDVSVSPSQERRDAFHMEMLGRDTRLGNEMANRADTRVSRSRPGVRRDGPRLLITPNTPAVGDLWDLNVAPGCSGALDQRTGRVVSIGQHVIVVADTSNPAGGFTTAQYDSIRLEFDSLAYPVDTANFGGPTDLDTNQRVVAFYTRAVNELSPPASSVITLGYFTARDLFSAAPESCPRSNEGEIFYMMVPDPTGAVNSNVRTVPTVRTNTVGTMAHELQHLINASRRIYLNGTFSGSLEEVWLNEGLSHIGEELMFYRTAVGLTPRSNITVPNINTGPFASRRVAAFNTYANPNFGRLRSWLQRPDTAGAFKNNDGLATRGAIWAFLRYAADRRNGDDATLWYSLVNTTTTGTTNLQTQLGVDPNEWLRDFVSAMYADDAVTGIGPAQQITSWNFRSMYNTLAAGFGNALVKRDLNNGVGLTLSYSRGGGTAYTRFGVPTGGFAGITALSGGVPPTSPFQLIVVRTR